MYQPLFDLEAALLKIQESEAFNPFFISPSDQTYLIAITTRITKKADKIRAFQAAESKEPSDV